MSSKYGFETVEGRDRREAESRRGEERARAAAGDYHKRLIEAMHARARQDEATIRDILADYGRARGGDGVVRGGQEEIPSYTGVFVISGFVGHGYEGPRWENSTSAETSGRIAHNWSTSWPGRGGDGAGGVTVHYACVDNGRLAVRPILYINDGHYQLELVLNQRLGHELVSYSSDWRRTGGGIYSGKRLYYRVRSRLAPK
jgi:hypothetical protein